MLDQSTDAECAGHWSERALCNPQSFSMFLGHCVHVLQAKERPLRRTTIDCFRGVSMHHGSPMVSWVYEPRVEKGLLIFSLHVLLFLSLAFNLLIAFIDGVIQARIIHCGS